jgi:hypothetical protein
MSRRRYYRAGQSRRDDLVQLAVPRAYVAQVAEFVTELERGDRRIERPMLAAAGPAQVPAGDWPDDLLERFAAGSTATHKTMIAVLDELSTRPAELVSAADLAAALGISTQKLAGTLAGLTRLLSAHYPYQRHGRPMTRIVRRGDHNREILFTVSPDQAQNWTRVRTRSNPSRGGWGP